jgi:hypothetical protein
VGPLLTWLQLHWKVEVTAAIWVWIVLAVAVVAGLIGFGVFLGDVVPGL